MSDRSSSDWQAKIRADTTALIRDVILEFGDAGPSSKGMAFDTDGECLVPAFQFHNSEIKPVITKLLEIAERYELTDRDVLFWLVSRTTYIRGDGRPVDLIDTDPDELLRIADASWNVAW